MPRSLPAILVLSAALASRAPASDVLEQRRAAWEALARGGREAIGPALASLESPGAPDARARELGRAFLASAHLAGERLEERVEALARAAAGDPEPRLRARALELLAEVDREAARERLSAIAPALPEPLRARAALLLAGRPRGEEGRAAARAAQDPGPLDAAWLAPRIAGEAWSTPLRPLRHADPRLSRAAELGLDGLVRRLQSLGDAQRADEELRALAGEGLDRCSVLLLRARLALTLGAPPETSRAAARELARTSHALADREGRAWRSVAGLLEAAAEVAAGRAAEAGRPLDEAEALLDGLLAERLDLRARDLAVAHVVALRRRAQVELLRIVAALARGEPDGGPDLLARAEAVHRLDLEAHLAGLRARLGVDASLDSLLSDELSPSALLFDIARSPVLPAPVALELRARLGRVLAGAAPRELPGCAADPAAGRPGPLEDPARAGLLRRIHGARLDRVAADLTDLRAAAWRRQEETASPPTPAEEARLEELTLEWLALLEQAQRLLRGEQPVLLEARAPCLWGLWLARALRNDGRAREARERAEAVRADLEASGDLRRYLFLEAEIEAVIGSTWTDDDEPARAEVELVRAVERLEAIEDLMRERGAGPGAIASARFARANALVGLAVNANVKQGDPRKALGYFERAYELRQDDWMRVLLACYRARSGRAEEARAVLRTVTPAPLTHYNTACTFALLGEGDLAFEFLRRESEENPLSESARARQRDWARRDPDLRSLRDDPRFRELFGP